MGPRDQLREGKSQSFDMVHKCKPEMSCCCSTAPSREKACLQAELPTMDLANLSVCKEKWPKIRFVKESWVELNSEAGDWAYRKEG
jgi:hypothetical protein